jgi:hypothetical protein
LKIHGIVDLFSSHRDRWTVFLGELRQLVQLAQEYRREILSPCPIISSLDPSNPEYENSILRLRTLTSALQEMEMTEIKIAEMRYENQPVGWFTLTRNLFEYTRYWVDIFRDYAIRIEKL